MIPLPAADFSTMAVRGLKSTLKLPSSFLFFPLHSSTLLLCSSGLMYRPRVFRWIDVFEREAFVLQKEHDGVRFPISRSCQANCQRLTSCWLIWPESNSLLLFTHSSPEWDATPPAGEGPSYRPLNLLHANEDGLPRNISQSCRL